MLHAYNTTFQACNFALLACIPARLARIAVLWFLFLRVVMGQEAGSIGSIFAIAFDPVEILAVHAAHAFERESGHAEYEAVDFET